MKTTISSMGQLVLPAEFRRMDGLKAGQAFEVERLDKGDYRLRRVEAGPNEGLVDWLLAAGKRRAALESWFDLGVERMVCLSWDAATALQWAALLARLRKKGEVMPLKDSMIAACAATHRLTVATRNIADFKKAGIPVVDPFSVA